jgi:hypothetical protein
LLIADHALKAVSNAKQNLLDMQAKIPSLKAHIIFNLRQSKDPIITAESHNRLFDEIFLRAANATIASIPSERKVYETFERAKQPLMNLVKKAKFNDYVPNSWERLWLCLFNTRVCLGTCPRACAKWNRIVMVETKTHSSLATLIEEYSNYYTSFLVGEDDMKNSFVKMYTEAIVNATIFSIVTTMATLCPDAAVEEDVNLSINRSLRDAVRRFHEYLVDTSDVDLYEPGLVPPAMELRSDETATTIEDHSVFDQIPVSNSLVIPNIMQSNIEHIQVMDTGFPDDGYDIFASYSASSSDSVCSNLTCTEIEKFLVQESVGTYPEVNSIIQTGTTSRFDVEYLYGIDSQKPIDESILEHKGVSVKVKTRDEKKETQTRMFVVGPVCTDIIPGCFNKTKHNEYIALVGRHINVTMPECNKFWQDARAKTWESFMQHFKIETFNSYCMNYDEWIEEQPTSKAARYKEVLFNIADMDFTEKKYHDREFFIKSEILPPPADEPAGLSGKAPRGIQGLKNNSSNMFLGCFMKGVSKVVSKSYELGSKFYYTSGSNASEIGEWYTYYKDKKFINKHKGKSFNMDYHFVEDDFSAYDSTQGQGAHETELMFYERILADCSLPTGVINNIRVTLSNQSHTYGFGGHHTYSVPYTRKSGDQNTSIGNTILNFFVHYYAILVYNKSSAPKNRIHDWAMMGLGDDNLLAICCMEKMLPSIMEKLTEIIKSFGLKPKMKSSKFPSYCSSHFMPVLDNNNKLVHVLTPSVVRALMKCGLSTSELSKKGATLERMKGNMLGIPIYSACPVMRVFFDYYTGLNVDGSEEYKWRNYMNDVNAHYRTSLETSNWFQELYHVSDVEIYELESYLKSSVLEHKGKPFLWSHEVFRKMLTA